MKPAKYLLIACAIALIACTGSMKPGETSKILFLEYDHSNKTASLYTMDPDGSDKTKVYSYRSNLFSWQARLSPQGSYITLVDQEERGRYDLLTMNSSGSGILYWAQGKEAWDACITQINAMFSPDEQKFLYNLPEGDYSCHGELFLSSSQKVEPRSLFSPVSGSLYLFSEDGNSIFLHADVVTVLEISTQDLSQHELFTSKDNLQFVDTRPDTLYYYLLTTEGRKFYSFNTKSGLSTHMITFSAGEEYFTFSPDGETVAFITSDELNSSVAQECGGLVIRLLQIGSGISVDLACEGPFQHFFQYSFNGKYIYAQDTVRQEAGGVLVFDYTGELVFADDLGFGGFFAPDSNQLVYWKLSESDGYCAHMVNIDTRASELLEGSCLGSEDLSPRTLDWK